MKEVYINSRTEEVVYDVENIDKHFSTYEVTHSEYDILINGTIDEVSDLVVLIIINR